MSSAVDRTRALEPPTKRRVIGLYENYTHEVQTHVIAVPSSASSAFAACDGCDAVVAVAAPVTPERRVVKSLQRENDENDAQNGGGDDVPLFEISELSKVFEEAQDVHGDIFGTPPKSKDPKPAPTPASTPNTHPASLSSILSPGFRHGWHAHNFEAPQEPRAMFSPPRPIPASHLARFDLPVEEDVKMVDTPRRAFHTDFFAPMDVVEELEQRRKDKANHLASPQNFARHAYCARDYVKSLVPEQRRVRSASAMLSEDGDVGLTHEVVTIETKTPFFGRRAFHRSFYLANHRTTESPQPMEAPRTRHYANNFEVGEPVRTNNQIPASPLRPAFHRKMYDVKAAVSEGEEDGTRVA